MALCRLSLLLLSVRGLVRLEPTKARSRVGTNEIRKTALEGKENTDTEIGRGADEIDKSLCCTKQETLHLSPESTILKKRERKESQA